MKRKDLNQLWNSIKDGLFATQPDKKANILMLLEGTRIEEINEKSSTVVISTLNKFSINMLSTPEFYKEIVNMTTNVLNSNFAILIVEKEEWESRDIEETTAEIEVMTVSDTLNPEYTLDNFIALSEKKHSNNFAKQTSLGVALQPGFWSPCFIHGGSGLGKTHLLHAIGNKMHETFPSLKIRYLESKDFRDLVYDGKISTQKVNAIINDLLMFDVLLVDDIQMIQSLTKAKDVFFDILSHFITQKKQIVLTSDQYPEQMSDFEERFITRFKSGAVLSVTPPDLDTAKEILIRKLKHKDQGSGLQLDSEALEFIAINFGSNVRELEGAINKILLYSITYSEPEGAYTQDDMLDIFDGMATNEGLTMQRITEVIAKHYHVKVADIKSASRKKEIAFARHMAIYFVNTLMDVSLMDIGRHFYRNHSTIIASSTKIEKMSVEDPELGKVIYDIRKKLTSK